MTAAHVIVGVVRDAGGAPVSGAVVSLTAGPVPLPDIATLSADDGSFAVTAPVPGRYQLACNFEDGATLRAQVDIPPDADHEVRADLSR